MQRLEQFKVSITSPGGGDARERWELEIRAYLAAVLFGQCRQQARLWLRYALLGCYGLPNIDERLAPNPDVYGPMLGEMTVLALRLGDTRFMGWVAEDMKFLDRVRPWKIRTGGFTLAKKRRLAVVWLMLRQIEKCRLPTKGEVERWLQKQKLLPPNKHLNTTREVFFAGWMRHLPKDKRTR